MTTAGIDVRKDHRDLATHPPTDAVRVPDTPDGHAALVARLAGTRLVVVEATGGDETAAVAALHAAAVPVAVVNPRPARDGAKALGRSAETDRLDAAVRAAFAARVAPPATPAASSSCLHGN